MSEFFFSISCITASSTGFWIHPFYLLKSVVTGVILTCIILLTVTVLVDKLLLFLIYPIVKRGIVEVVMDDSGVTAFLYPAMVH